MLGKALASQEGANLAYLLRPTGPHSNDLVKAFRNPSVGNSNFLKNVSPYLT